jgi:hypothetical protein
LENLCKGDLNQADLAYGQSRRICKIVFASSWQTGQELEDNIPLLNKFVFVGSEELQARHMNILILFGTVTPHIDFQNKWVHDGSLVGVERELFIAARN